MNIRAVTVGTAVEAADCRDFPRLQAKLAAAAQQAEEVAAALRAESFTVQTVRIATNTFEEWLLPATDGTPASLISLVEAVERELARLGVDFCSFGPASTAQGLAAIPDILSHSRASCSAALGSPSAITADRLLSNEAARVCFEVARRCGDLGNFRFCASFRMPANSPFFPAAYHNGALNAVSIGLENGGMVLAGCSAAKDHTHARDTLRGLLLEALRPIQSIAQSKCDALGIVFAGIDASFNPGLSLPGSIANGLQSLIPSHTFGHAGTLAAVATLTSALKTLSTGSDLKLAGYCGLMLPVMEDLVLAARAAESPPTFRLRDLLWFSSVCGVGLDTVPVPGTKNAEGLAAIYEDVAAMAFRLEKPLTCRVLPMAGLEAGDLTSVESPFLCNTRVFALE